MPIIEVNGAKLYYEDSGGATDTILFCHGLICNCHMFSDSFLKNSENIEMSEKWRQYVLNNSRKGAARAVKGVIERKGVFDQLNKIRLPSLIIVGDQDKLADPNDSIPIHVSMRLSIPYKRYTKEKKLPA